MIRNEWRFQFEAGSVADAARREAAYHRERYAWWLAEQDRVTAEVERSGVQIREFEVTGGRQKQVVIDPTLQGRLSECDRKMQRHTEEAEQYEMWADAMDAMPTEQIYDLDPEDVRYFRLAGVREVATA